MAVYTKNALATGATITKTALDNMESGIAAAVIATAGIVAVDFYGAKGDGTTDDYAAIMSAIAALPTTGGTLVFTGGKTYVTSGVVEVLNKVNISVVLDGAAIASTATGDASAVLRLENVAGGKVTGGYLYHKNTGSRKAAADGLTIEQSSDILVENVRTGYVYSIGIRVSGSNRVTINGCVVRDSLADGIGVYGGERYARTGINPSNDGAISAGSTTLTSVAGFFQQHDVGAYILVTGAGAGGGDLLTTVVSRQSFTQITLAVAASTTSTAAFIRIRRHCVQTAIVGNHVFNSGDDSISSVGYLSFPSPNTDLTVIGNTIIGSHARGILLAGTDTSAIVGNTLRNIYMGGVFGVVETGNGNPTTYGVKNTTVGNNPMQSICTDFANGANYGAIGCVSDSDTYIVDGFLASDNTIRDAYSYYLAAGAFGSSNTPASVREVRFVNNQLLEGNRNNPAIYANRVTNFTVVGNRVSRSRATAIVTYDTMAGAVVVHDNEITNSRRDGTTGDSIALSTTGGVTNVVYNNLINNTLVASGQTGGGANPGGTAA